MERREALIRLRKILGKEFAYEIKPNASSEEEREQARQHHPELLAKREEISKAMAARREELLKDTEYQQLCEEWKKADKAVTANNGILHIYKFTVGTADKLFFHVKAQGNSWEEIFAKLGKKGT